MKIGYIYKICPKVAPLSLIEAFVNHFSLIEIKEIWGNLKNSWKNVYYVKKKSGFIDVFTPK